MASTNLAFVKESLFRTAFLVWFFSGTGFSGSLAALDPASERRVQPIKTEENGFGFGFIASVLAISTNGTPKEKLFTTKTEVNYMQSGPNSERELRTPRR